MKLCKSLMVNLFMIVTLNCVAGSFENSEFKISSLSYNKEKDAHPVLMKLPQHNGFSANVTVMIQHSNKTIDDYRTLSSKQLKKMGLKAIQDNKISNTLLFEYSGLLNKNNLHFYQIVHKKGNTFYIVTATSLESTWEKDASKLKDCVGSFTLKQAGGVNNDQSSVVPSSLVEGSTIEITTQTLWQQKMSHFIALHKTVGADLNEMAEEDRNKLIAKYIRYDSMKIENYYSKTKDNEIYYIYHINAVASFREIPEHAWKPYNISWKISFVKRGNSWYYEYE